MNKLETTVKRQAAIKEKGLDQERKKHTVYYYKLYRKGMISEKDYLDSYNSTLQILAGF